MIIWFDQGRRKETRRAAGMIKYEQKIWTWTIGLVYTSIQTHNQPQSIKLIHTVFEILSN